MFEFSLALINGNWTVQAWVDDTVIYSLACRSRKEGEKIAQAYSKRSHGLIAGDAAILYVAVSTSVIVNETLAVVGCTSRQRDLKRTITGQQWDTVEILHV